MSRRTCRPLSNPLRPKPLPLPWRPTYVPLPRPFNPERAEHRRVQTSSPPLSGSHRASDRMREGEGPAQVPLKRTKGMIGSLAGRP